MSAEQENSIDIVASRDWLAEHRKRVIDGCDKYGEIGPLEDGYQHYWIKDRGALSSTDLRIIADELDRRNKELDACVRRDLSMDDSDAREESKSLRQVVDDLKRKQRDIVEWAEREKESLSERAYEMDYGCYSAMMRMVKDVLDIVGE